MVAKLQIKAIFLFLLTLFIGCNDDPVKNETPKRKGIEYRISSKEDMDQITGRLLPGDSVILIDGTYSGLSLSISAKGLEDNPIFLKAETPGKVILKGNSNVEINGQYITVSGLSFTDRIEPKGSFVVKFGKNSKGCVLSDCLVDGSGVSPNVDIVVKWILIYGHGNEVSNCTFLNKHSFGVLLEAFPEETTVDHKILRNRFTRPYSYLTATGGAVNGQEVVRIGTSDSCDYDAGCIVKGNYFYMCYGERAEIISNKSCRNTYTGNYFSACMGALTLRHGINCIVNGNYFTGPDGTETEVNKRSGGIRIIGSNHNVFDNYMCGLTGSGYNSAICLMRGDSQEYDDKGNFKAGYQQVHNCSIMNNTIVDCAVGISMNQGGGTGEGVNDVPPYNLTFSGNIISTGKATDFTVTLYEQFDLSTIAWTDNTIYGGKQNNTSFPTVSQKPYVKDRSAEMKAIVSASGVRW